MTHVQAVIAALLALGWVPLAIRFQRGWHGRKNPVSLALCVALLVCMYTELMFGLALLGQASWQFFAISTQAAHIVAVGNLYVSFYWSDRRFPDARRRGYSIPPQTLPSRNVPPDPPAA